MNDLPSAKELRQRLEAIIGRLSHVVYIKDPDGRYLLMNSAGEALFEIPREEIVGTRDEELFGPDEAEDIRTIDARVMEEREPVTYESQRPVNGEERVFRNEKYPYVPDGDEVRGVIGVSVDVTDDKRRQRALERLHEATRELMAAPTAESVATITTQTTAEVIGHEVNAVHLYDEGVGGLVPVTWSDLTDVFGGDQPPTIHEGEGLAWMAYASGEPHEFADVRTADDVLNPETPIRSEIILPLGDHGVLLIASTTIDDFDENDEALAHVFAANVEAALDRVERERELQHQNERLSEFAGVVSHDIRSPLNVASGTTELLSAEYTDSRFDRLSGALDRIATIVDDVLTWARQGRTVEETEPVSVGTLAKRCWAESDTGQATLVVEDDVHIEADRERFRRVLENLFRNAVEHGGRDVSVRVGRTNDGSGFFVSDSGPGIPDDEREAVFDLGYSDSDQGTGFGLAICEQIAEAHGWSVTLTESDGSGARFEFSGVEVRES